MSTHPLFVYGTLRRGGVRAMPSLFPYAVYVGDGSVRGWLYDFGAYPGFLPDPNGGFVCGELYLIDDTALEEIDGIEGFDPGDEEGSYYVRQRVVVALSDGRSQEAWVYVCNPRYFDLSRRIDSGDWIAHAEGSARTSTT